jgi:hypothetical protein
LDLSVLLSKLSVVAIITEAKVARSNEQVSIDNAPFSSTVFTRRRL